MSLRRSGLLVLPTLGLIIAAVAAVTARSGPTPPPVNNADWPGKGIAGAYDAWTQRRDLFWSERAKDQNAVVFLGDSITHGWSGLAGQFPTMKVANRGIGSDTSRRVVFRLKEDVLDLHPRGVVLLIGINDLAAGVSPGDVAYNIRLILDAIRKADAGTPVVLCHVMPWKKEAGKHTQRIRQLNALIDGLAVGRPNVAVCDTWKGLATPEGAAVHDAQDRI